MCVTPSNMDEVGLVACRYCWQCRKNRVNDLVGRCIAESLTADQTLALTLTYRGDGPETAMLNYPDVQKFLKRLRAQGYEVRYIVAGEYGSKKGRAHWHMILFFYGKTLLVADFQDERGPWDVVLEERHEWAPWTGWGNEGSDAQGGFVYFQKPDYGAFAYLLKYVLKDLEAEVHRTHLAMSKKPPLGFKFFIDRAQAFVDQGLAPQDLKYEFKAVFDAKNRRRKFMLQGRMREIFLHAFVDMWEAQRKTPLPYSEVVEESEDERCGLDKNYAWAKHIAKGGKQTAQMEIPVLRHIEARDYYTTLYEGTVRGIPVALSVVDYGGSQKAVMAYDQLDNLGRKEATIWESDDPKEIAKVLGQMEVGRKRSGATYWRQQNERLLEQASAINSLIGKTPRQQDKP